MRKHGEDRVFTITGARQGLADDVRGRQRRYVISMSVRTASVIAAAALWNVERHVAIVALVLGVVMPYIAVVIANAGRETAPKPPSTFVPGPPVAHPVLEAPRPQAEDAAQGPGRRPGTREPEPGQGGDEPAGHRGGTTGYR